MIVGVPRESFPGERRVALVPAVIPNLAKAGSKSSVEAGAGVEAGYTDAEYVAKGAKILLRRAEVFSAADIITQVLCYGSNDRTGEADLPLFHRDQVLVGFLRPLGSLQHCSRHSRQGGHISFDRADAADHASTKYGRALFDGHDLRLQGGLDRCGHAP